jgi:hypothetical protein
MVKTFKLKIDYKIKIIEFAKENGFINDGYVAGSHEFMYKPLGTKGSKFVPVDYPDRARFILPNTNWKATIGNRTTSFYEVINHRVDKFYNFLTKNEDEIKQFIEGIH